MFVHCDWWIRSILQVSVLRITLVANIQIFKLWLMAVKNATVGHIITWNNVNGGIHVTVMPKQWCLNDLFQCQTNKFLSPLSISTQYLLRRRSRINGDQFPKQWVPKAQASRRSGGLQFPFLGFWVIQTGYWLVPLSSDEALRINS